MQKFALSQIKNSAYFAPYISKFSKDFKNRFCPN